VLPSPALPCPSLLWLLLQARQDSGSGMTAARVSLPVLAEGQPAPLVSLMGAACGVCLHTLCLPGAPLPCQASPLPCSPAHLRARLMLLRCPLPGFPLRPAASPLLLGRLPHPCCWAGCLTPAAGPAASPLLLSCLAPGGHGC
jgi:hypothetical protein